MKRSIGYLLFAVVAISELAEGAKEKESSLQSAGKNQTYFTNSLGMVFKSVNGVDPMVSIFETRVCDFERFVNETGYGVGPMKSFRIKEEKGKGWYASLDEKGETWNKTEFPQNGKHPVTGVNKTDAIAFTKWLTEKDAKEGKLKEGESYRLPRNCEFDVLVGIKPLAKGESAMKRFVEVQQKYKNNLWRDAVKAGDLSFHWGNYWPATSLDGNFHSQESYKAKLVELPNDAYTGVYKNFRSDGYAFTAPVGTYNEDKNGLYDIDGNVLEIVEEYGESDDVAKKYFTRGTAWNSNWDWEFFPSNADMRPNDERLSNIGFRLVLESKNK